MDSALSGPGYIADADVGEALDQELRDLLSGCFSDPCFAGRRYCHEMPAHRWIVRDAGGLLAAHLAVHDKVIGTKEGDLRIAGMAEVCVHPDFRGRGLVRKLLDEAHAWAEGLGIPFAMLFGRAGVYDSSGYVHIQNPIRRLEAAGGGWVSSAMPAAMVRGLHLPPAWPQGEIDLRGPVF